MFRNVISHFNKTTHVLYCTHHLKTHKIKIVKSLPEHPSALFRHYVLVRHFQNKADKKGVIYCYDPFNDRIGKGTFGAVFKASLVNSQGEMDPSKSKAIKTIPDQFYFSYETEVLNTFFPTYCIQDNKNKHFIITDFHPGMTLMNRHRNLAKSISTLTLQMKIKLIVSILLNINNIHGRGIIHLDIKGENIQVDIHPEKQQADATVIDFGASLLLPSFDPEIKEHCEISGTLGHIAPEVIHETVGLKSDIYSLVPLILAILDANDPYRLKDIAIQKSDEDSASLPKELQDEKAYASDANTKYDFAGLLKNEPDAALRMYVFHFLQRMQETYAKRPDCQEILRFFTTIYYYLKDNEDKCIYEAKLTLLASGMWQHYFDPQKSKYSSFEEFDFEKNIDFCKALQLISSYKMLLTKDLLDEIFKLKEMDLTHVKELLAANHGDLSNTLIESKKENQTTPATLAKNTSQHNAEKPEKLTITKVLLFVCCVGFGIGACVGAGIGLTGLASALICGAIGAVGAAVLMGIGFAGYKLWHSLFHKKQDNIKKQQQKPSIKNQHAHEQGAKLISTLAQHASPASSVNLSPKIVSIQPVNIASSPSFFAPENENRAAVAMNLLPIRLTPPSPR